MLRLDIRSKSSTSGAVDLPGDARMWLVGASEDRVAALVLEGLPGAVIAVDLEDRVVVWNAEAEQLYGWTAEEVLGRRYASATDTITARQPSRDEAEILQIRPDTPVLHLLHVAFDETRKPIEVAQATWPGPMTTLTEDYRIPAPTPDPDPDPGFALA